MENYSYGYARVSTVQQDLSRQLDLLNQYNCIEIVTEKMSGTKTNRPELMRLKDKVRPGDTIIIESFSRLGRSTRDLIELVEYFKNKRVTLISIKENFDTNTPQGNLMLTVFEAFSQFERELIVQRTKEGLESARARGRKGGRPKVKERNIEQALKLYDSKEYSISEIVKMSRISQATLYRYIHKQGNSSETNINPSNEKTAQILMSIRVENNNKFVRGKKKARENIEKYLDYYNMKKTSPKDDEYIIFVKYKNIDDLKNTVYEIFHELENEADLKNCFTEGEACCNELGLKW
ncbi:recombinase family protein [Clostridium sp.]|uniref:recombinase family protein n=1 Tax=Clostridium sp. TaxID=1506 RepID=UPI001A5F2962|nr:recombinase family protein [Clostridium sp.]MBK5235594.1 recombinase family protein [Clostridium sp.]